MATTRIEPIRLGPGDRVGVIAGSGRLPVEVAQKLAAAGHPPFVLIVEGEADADPMMGFEHVFVAVEQFPKLISVLRQRAVTHLVMAGGIARRPKWSAIRPTFDLLRHLPRAIAGLAGGDNRLLSLLAQVIEGAGIRVVGAHEIVPELLAAEGTITRAKPSGSDWRDLDAGFVAARTIGGLDVGQAAVAIGGRAVELEGIEGTDGLLERVRRLRGHGRLAGRQRGVLVKCAKPDQEMRADLPSIGPSTVEAAHAAGLAGIGVEAGRSLVLEGPECVARANELGLFIVGIPEGGRNG